MWTSGFCRRWPTGRSYCRDRFTDSTLVYQGAARGLGAEVVYEVDRIACRGLVPDLTLVIDIDAEIGPGARARAAIASTQDVETRLDEQAFEFHRKVRDGVSSTRFGRAGAREADRRIARRSGCGGRRVADRGAAHSSRPG